MVPIWAPTALLVVLVAVFAQRALDLRHRAVTDALVVVAGLLNGADVLGLSWPFLALWLVAAMAAGEHVARVARPVSDQPVLLCATESVARSVAWTVLLLSAGALLDAVSR